MVCVQIVDLGKENEQLKSEQAKVRQGTAAAQLHLMNMPPSHCPAVGVQQSSSSGHLQPVQWAHHALDHCSCGISPALDEHLVVCAAQARETVQQAEQQAAEATERELQAQGREEEVKARADKLNDCARQLARENVR